MKTVRVSKPWIDLLAERAEALMTTDPDLRHQWMDQVITSRASMAAGGIVALTTDYDWPIAFFIWREGGQLLREGNS